MVEKQESMILKAEGFNLRLFPRQNKKDQKRENRYSLIQSKREMFLVVQMLNIKSKEIAKLEEFTNMRGEGLKQSELLLHSEIKNFIEFFKKNREESTNEIRTAENLCRIK